MAKENYEVLVPELTVMRSVGELRDPASGEVTGHQQSGKIRYKGDVLSADEISPLTLEILENEDHPQHESVSRKLRKVSAEPKDNLDPRVGQPFAGYDDMDEEDIVRAMANLPSATIQQIKTYESAHENRELITTYSVGFGESPVARQKGLVSSEAGEPAEGKPSSKIKTRTVPEEGVVEPGEGITGTGDPAVAPGTTAAAEEDEGTTRANRRGRRARGPRTPQNEDSSDSGSSES